MNTSEELNFVKDVAAATGVILDPVYRYLFVPQIVHCQIVLCMGLLVQTFRMEK